MHIRIFAPSLNYRLTDPMPLPRRSAAARRIRIHVRNLAARRSTGPQAFKVKKVPVGK